MSGGKSFGTHGGVWFVCVLVAALTPGLFHVRLAAGANAQNVAQGAAASAAGISRDGIEVHGHWVIEIREPDGRIVSRREFENELEATGQEVLAALLMQKAVVGPWAVKAGLDFCAKELIGTYPGCTKSATTGELTAVSSGGAVVLTGVAVAPTAISFNVVATAVGVCDAGTNPCSFGTPGFRDLAIFSLRAIPAQAVAAGQIMQATVTISFSAAP